MKRIDNFGECQLIGYSVFDASRWFQALMHLHLLSELIVCVRIGPSMRNHLSKPCFSPAMLSSFDLYRSALLMPASAAEDASLMALRLRQGSKALICDGGRPRQGRDDFRAAACPLEHAGEAVMTAATV